MKIYTNAKPSVTKLVPITALIFFYKFTLENS